MQRVPTSNRTSTRRSLVPLSLALALLAQLPTLAAESPQFEAELIFPFHNQHNHAPGIVECPNGDLFVSWYRGSGERTADDVAVYGAWRAKGEPRWGEPFVMADTPGFPDCNTALFVDDRKRLWLFYPTILANTWESCLTNFKVSSRFAPPGSTGVPSGVRHLRGAAASVAFPSSPM